MAIHSSAVCTTESVPDSAEIGPFAVISEDARIGEDVVIGAHVTVGKGVQLGDRVNIQAGVRLNDGCLIEQDVTVGANATVSAGVRLHMGASIAPGASVVMDVPPFAIISGSEGSITGYVDANLEPSGKEADIAPTHHATSRVRGVGLFEMPNFLDLRGNLSVGEFEQNLPFYPKRFFIVYGVTSEQVRGEHAHHACHQFLICTHGACSVIADDGFERQEFRLNEPTRGLHLPPMVWGIQYKFTRDATLLVFASDHYDAEDYIRDYNEFIENVRAKKH